MDIAQFRANFPEFTDIARYPDGLLTFWAGIAEQQVNCNRWKLMTANGVMLYVAHEITLAAQNQKAAGIGGVPGGTSGPANSKTVGSVTVAYDTQQTAEKDAGWWNLTTYGKQFIRLARMFGAGAVQI
jgi:hypothetical protein